MLLEFTLSNYKCFRFPATLSFLAAKADRKLRGNIFQGQRSEALKSVLLFGANAAGKTTLLEAIAMFSRFVAVSATRMTLEDPIPCAEPFLLSADEREKPSVFEVAVEIDGAGFRYRVAVSPTAVVEERLEHQASSKGAAWITLIDRASDRPPALHERLGTTARRRQLVEDTRPNGLLVSRAAERNVEVVIPLFNWIRSHLAVGPGVLGRDGEERMLRTAAKRAKEDPEFRARLEALVRDADTGIVALDTETAARTYPPTIRFAVQSDRPRNELNTVELVPDKRVVTFDRFFTFHAGESGDSVRFETNQESMGTRRFLAIASHALLCGEAGGLLVLDELDASLHPHLARRLVEMFHSPAYNAKGAQLLATAQDTSLLDGTLLRRDQIVFSEKNFAGSARLRSLWDIEERPRNDTALARNYLAGRYGGVPHFGPSLEDVPHVSDARPAPRPGRDKR